MKQIAVLFLLVFILPACKNVFTEQAQSSINGILISDTPSEGDGDDEESAPPGPPQFPSIFNSSIPIQTGGAANMSIRHTCGVTKSANVLCWGSNTRGQLGDGTIVGKTVPTLVVGGDQGGALLENITEIATGHSHTCAIDTNQQLFCWGSGGDVLGQGSSTADSNVPLRVVTGDQANASGFLEGVVQVGAGYSVTCALTTSKNVFCWGPGGRIGGGANVAANAPQYVVTGAQMSGSGHLENIRQLGVGYRSTCAVSETNNTYCWGDGRGVGDGAGGARYSPVRPLSGKQGGGTYLADVRQVTSGWNRSCAVTNAGAVYCWGSASDNFGHDGSSASTPVSVLAGEQTVGNDGVHLGNVKQIEGTSTYCAITNDDDFFCWGTNMSATPARIPSSDFESGFVSNPQSLSFVLGTMWVFDNQGRPFGSGFNYHSTFLGAPGTFLTGVHFIDIEE